MILAVVDDLMFKSKIAAAAKHANAQVVFTRSPEETLEQARATKPHLVIFDLSSSRLDALRTIAALKADPGLSATRMLGFVSHLQSAVVAAAREAGVHDVLARSAFAEKLPQILEGG
jgi:PleD family two-component response regulator